MRPRCDSAMPPESTAIQTTMHGSVSRVSVWTWVSRYRWLLLILLAHLPLLIVHFSNLSIRPQYQHFPLIIVAFLCLLATRLSPLESASENRKQGTVLPALVLWIVSLTLLILATVFFSPWFAAFSFLVAVGGCFLALRKELKIESAVGLWLICALLVPVPGNFEAQLSQALQRSTTFTSGAILSALEIPNFVQGTTLSIASGRLFVEEACSGIVSMMSVLATCLVLAVILKRPLLHTVLLVISGLLWASAMNIVRITAISVFREWFEIDLAEGWEHTALGLIVYVGSLLLIVSTDCFLNYLIHPGVHPDGVNPVQDSPSVRVWLAVTQFGAPNSGVINSISQNDPSAIQRSEERGPEEANAGHPEEHIPFVRQKLVAVLSIAFFILGLTGLGRVFAWTGPAASLGMTSWDSPVVDTLSADTMPAQIDGWKQNGFGKSHKKRLFAQESRLWQFNKPNAEAVFSIDFTFPQWHDLCECYRGIGWKQTSVSDYRDLATQPYVTAEFMKKDRDSGQLYFSHCEPNGEFAPPINAMSVLQQLKQRVQSDRTLIQIQLWVTRGRAATKTEAEQDEKLFLTLRDRILQTILESEARKP